MWQRSLEVLGGVFVVSAIVVILTACSDEKSGKGQASRTVASSRPAAKVIAGELVKEYGNNEVAADQKYKGKVLEVTGVVGSIKKDIMDTIYVTLGTGKDFEFSEVQCFFADKYAGQAAALRKGQSVTVRGQCDGLLMNVLLRGCIFVR